MRHVLGGGGPLARFLYSLVARGMHWADCSVSDDHAGLGIARQALLPDAMWQHCQCNLRRSAFHRAPTAPIGNQIGIELREVWNALRIERA